MDHAYSTFATPINIWEDANQKGNLELVRGKTLQGVKRYNKAKYIYTTVKSVNSWTPAIRFYVLKSRERGLFVVHINNNGHAFATPINTWEAMEGLKCESLDVAHFLDELTEKL